MDIGSIWSLKPYINPNFLYHSPNYNKSVDDGIEHALENQSGYDPIRFTLTEINPYAVGLTWVDKVWNNEDRWCPMTKTLFLEIMEQVEEAPPMVDNPKPYYHGKRVAIRDQEAMQYLCATGQSQLRGYMGTVWNVEFHEGVEGRANYIHHYGIETDNGTCIYMFPTELIEKCFEVVD